MPHTAGWFCPPAVTLFCCWPTVQYLQSWPCLSAPDRSSDHLLHTSIWAVLQALQLNWANDHLLKGLPASSPTPCLPCNRLQIWLSTVCLSLFSANPSSITFSCRIKANSLEQKVNPSPHHRHCFPLLHCHHPLFQSYDPVLTSMPGSLRPLSRPCFSLFFFKILFYSCFSWTHFLLEAFFLNCF